MDSTGQLGEHGIDRTGNFLQRLHAFGGDFAGGVPGVVAVAGGAASFHRGEAAHAAILFVAFATDFNNVAGRFLAAGEQAATNYRVRQRECFDNITALGHAPIGDEGDALGRRAFGRHVKSRELRDAHAGDDARGANGAGPLADLD